MYGPLNDPHFVLLVLFCAAVITVGAIVTALHRIPRAEFTQFQSELSERVRVLEAAEQRRFMRELNPRGEDGEAKYTNGNGPLTKSVSLQR
jgi:hypothetical protein